MSIRVCMLLYGPVQHDSRVRKEAATLVEAGFEVVIGALPERREAEERMLDGARVIPVHPMVAGALFPDSTSPFLSVAEEGRGSKLQRRVAWLWRYGRTLRAWSDEALRILPRADIWHGHDLFGLWAAARLRARHGGRLVYDSHELFLELGTAARLPTIARRVLFVLERRLARGADAVITVNDSIAAELARRYGLSPTVVMNCSEIPTIHGHHPLRRAFGLGQRPVVLFHGALQEGRGLAQLVGAIPLLTGAAAVVLLGDGPLHELYRQVASTATYAEKLYVHPAVDREVLPEWVADADVGVVPFQAVDYNHYLATPNRLFDYLAAGVPVVVSDFPELRRIVDETDAGLTCDPAKPASIAAAINRLLDEPESQREQRHERARAGARDRYNWPAQGMKLLETYRSISALDGPWGR